MNKQTALKTIFGFSVLGLAFSGYLSYYELFVPGGCEEAIVSCGEKEVLILSLPACVYGFFMYLIIFGVSLAGLLNRAK